MFSVGFDKNSIILYKSTGLGLALLYARFDTITMAADKKRSREENMLVFHAPVERLIKG